MHRLALALGRTVEELKNTLGSGELSYWKAYYTIEPFGAWRDNFHAAQIAQAIYNMNGAKPPRKAADFFYESVNARRARETGAFLAKLDALAVKNGKK